jgi:hypothetical protein
VCSNGWQRNREFTRDVRPVQIALQQTQNLKLSLAERLDQGLCGDPFPWPCHRRSSEQLPHVFRRVPILGCELEQGHHRRPLVEEQADVALQLGDLDGASQRRRGAIRIVGGMTGERLHDQDVQGAAVPATSLSRG